MQQTIILKDQCYLHHETRYGHPESPQRLMAIYESLAAEHNKGLFMEVRPRKATRDEIELNHTLEYIRSIERTAGKGYISLDPDTNTSDGTWTAAILASGAVLTAIDWIQDKKACNGFALVRPPGHHAERSRAMGFCIFNNVAIGAHYLLKKHRINRVLIVDWDLHHGNGTQNSFYSSSEVLFFSMHQYPYYPGSGSIDETGEKDGRGFTVNIPLSGGQGDEDYVQIMQQILVPLVCQFKPQFILVSAGYDIHHLDPLGTMKVTPRGFYDMTKILLNLANEICDGKILLTLEGGYHIQGISDSVQNTIYALTDKPGDTFNQHNAARQKNSFLNTQTIIKKVKHVHSARWTNLK